MSEVQKTEDQLPSTFVCDEADLHAGLEGVSSQDIRFPILKLLQDNSPQVKKKGDSYIDGAEPGMFIDPDSNKIFDGETGLLIIPCACVKSFIEWIDRDSGGGIAGVYSFEEGKAKEEMQAKLLRKIANGEALKESESKQLIPESNMLKLHHNYYCYLINEETKEHYPIIVSLSSTGLKASGTWLKDIMSQVQRKRGMQSIVYRITSEFTKNAKGEFFTWKVKPYKKIEEVMDNAQVVYKDAVEFGKGASELNKQIDFSSIKEEELVDEVPTAEYAEDQLDGVM